MTRFALNPGRRIGEIRDWLEAEAEAGRIEPGEPGEYYLQYLEEHRDELGLPPVSSAEEPVTAIESTPA
jgi:poly(A) polymerase